MIQTSKLLSMAYNTHGSVLFLTLTSVNSFSSIPTSLQLLLSNLWAQKALYVLRLARPTLPQLFTDQILVILRISSAMSFPQREATAEMAPSPTIFVSPFHSVWLSLGSGWARDHISQFPLHLDGVTWIVFTSGMCAEVMWPFLCCRV